MRKVGADGKEQRSTNFYRAPYVTPAQFAALTPVDGDECYFIADATNGVIWHLRYNAGSSSAYKWEYLGGPPLISIVMNNETTNSATITDLPTPGPSITVPRAGDYFYEGKVGVAPSAGTAYTYFGQGELHHTSVYGWTAAGATNMASGLAASGVLHVQYQSASSANTQAWKDRQLAVWPRRIS